MFISIYEYLLLLVLSSCFLLFQNIIKKMLKFIFYLVQAEIEKQIRQKVELQTTHAQQMHFKALRQEAERQEEEEFKKQVCNIGQF